MRNSSSPVLRRFVADCPVTTAMVAVAIALWIAVEIWSTQLPRGIGEARSHLGAVGSYLRLEMDVVEERLVPVPQTSGPYDVWQGEWWRVAISGFHHANLLHLIMNCTGLLFLGWLLEPRMGRFRYLLFFVSATATSMLPEYLLGHDAIGLSGTAYALFGVLFILRERNDFIASFLTPAIVQFSFVWLFGCVVVTYLDLVGIANVAHFTGFIYGWIAGQVLYGRLSAWTGIRWAFVAAHLLLVPGFYYVMHPFWNGHYLWYLAFREAQPERKVELLERVVKSDPSLRRAWDQLGAAQWQAGKQQQAWRTVLEGLKRNRSNEHGMQLARLYWQTFAAKGEQEAARKIVQTVFGDGAADWQERLEVPATEIRTLDQLQAQQSLFSALANNSPIRIEFDQDVLDRLKPGPQRVPSKGTEEKGGSSPIDPDAAGSAAEGVQL